MPGMLSSRALVNNFSCLSFSSRFLKVYPDIATMPSWNEASMPEEVLDEWERIWFLDQPSHLTPLRTHGGII